MEIKCSCGNLMKSTEADFKGFKVRAWVCQCGEELLDPKQTNMILKLRKAIKQGLKVTLGRVGNNLVVRIPRIVEEAYHLREGRVVDLELSNKGILVEALAK